MSEKDLTISEMQKMQFDLYERNKDKWGDREPKYAKNHILYMIEEIGECISIIKKKGIDEIMENQEVRNRFLEEMADVEMYYMEVLNRLKVSPEEFSDSYNKKHHINMGRDFEREHKEKYKN